MRKKMRLLWHATLIVLLFALFACQTVPEKVQQMSQAGRFQEARALLEKESSEVGGDSKKQNEIEVAKKIFAGSVLNHYKALSEESISQGKPREALRRLQEAQEICPWSEDIASEVTSAQTMVNQISQLERKWHDESSAQVLPPGLSREVVKDLLPFAMVLEEAQSLRNLLEVGRKSLMSYWADQVQSSEGILSETLTPEFASDLEAVVTQLEQRERIRSMLGDIARLPRFAAAPLLPTSHEQFDALISALASDFGSDASHFAFSSKATIIVESFQAVFDKWKVTDLAYYLRKAETAHEALIVAEGIYDREPTIRSNPVFVNALSGAHLLRAATLSQGGLCSAVAFLHLARAKELAPAGSENNALSVEKRVESAYSTIRVPIFKYRISVSPSVSPNLQSFITHAVSTAFEQRLRADREASLVAEGESDVDADVTIDEVKLDIPDPSQLRTVGSTFFSHYQESPNPSKSWLKLRLDQEASDVEYAERSYNSAVSSYNMYPTDYGLNNVNNAYNRYKMAINNYNYLVNTYNMTPATIQEEVYLPYQYQEGQMRLGWTLRISSRVGDQTRSFLCTSIDQDYVRIGTKSTDREVSRRTDRYPSYNISFENLMRHLSSAMDQALGSIDKMLLGLGYTSLIDLDSTESEALKAFLHPWGFRPSLSNYLQVAAWAKKSIGEVAFKTSESLPPSIRIPAKGSAVAKSRSVEGAAKELEQFVCLISSVSNGNQIDSGTGSLVGPNGLVLTASHVLLTPEIKIVFSSGKYKGSYNATPLFVNRSRDVAVLQIRGLKNDSWVRTRLQKPSTKGEGILAIGNPSILGEAINVGGVSAGVVSNPEVEVFGQPQLICDITIASGSSGGPVFSLESGELIGVVLAVAAPGLQEKGVSSSGYYCLAAPSSELGKWLGFQGD
jgi:hypothetical protein